MLAGHERGSTFEHGGKDQVKTGAKEFGALKDLMASLDWTLITPRRTSRTPWHTLDGDNVYVWFCRSQPWTFSSICIFDLCSPLYKRCNSLPISNFELYRTWPRIPRRSFQASSESCLMVPASPWALVAWCSEDCEGWNPADWWRQGFAWPLGNLDGLVREPWEWTLRDSWENHEREPGDSWENESGR